MPPHMIGKGVHLAKVRDSLYLVTSFIDPSIKGKLINLPSHGMDRGRLNFTGQSLPQIVARGGVFHKQSGLQRLPSSLIQVFLLLISAFL